MNYKNKDLKDYHNAINFLEGLSNLSTVQDHLKGRRAEIFLKRTRYFLDLLGNPDKNLKIIHVGGTAGKGSVSTLVQSMLIASGKQTGVFTSPFATTSTEKIKVGENYISPRDFADIIEELKPQLDYAYLNSPYGLPSYFEIFFAIALTYFKRQKCKWVVLEVGCGGHYDATNVITNPLVTAITNVDYDHCEILGKTLTKIAKDKAGIIKPGSQFFTSEHRPHILKILYEECKNKNVPCHHLSKEKDYQKQNFTLASAIALSLGVEKKSIKQMCNQLRLPCRFEHMQSNPAVILDGAHNPAKIQTTVQNLSKLNYSKLYLVISVARDKDIEKICQQIVPYADHIYITRYIIKERKCAHPSYLAPLVEGYKRPGASVSVYLDPNMALETAMVKAKERDLVLVTGSFFLTGELRKWWYPEEWVLSHQKSFR